MYSLLWLHLYISLQLLVLPCHVQKVIIKTNKQKKESRCKCRSYWATLFYRLRDYSNLNTPTITPRIRISHCCMFTIFWSLLKRIVLAVGDVPGVLSVVKNVCRLLLSWCALSRILLAFSRYLCNASNWARSISPSVFSKRRCETSAAASRRLRIMQLKLRGYAHSRLGFSISIQQI